MGGALISIFQKIGYVIAELNDKFYLNIDIRTYISWLVIVMMYLLYRVLTQYVLPPAPLHARQTPPPPPQKLSSIDLVKLLAVYFMFLTFFLIAYVDFQKVKANHNSQFMLMVLGAIIVSVIVLVAWLGEDVQRRRTWILLTLYAPIFLLIISNGRILEERLESFKSILPRSEFSFISLPGEVEKVRVGGRISQAEIENIIKKHPAVEQCTVIARQDPKDKFIKTFAYVVIKSGYKPTNVLKQKICWFLTGQEVTCFKFPEIKFVTADELKSLAGAPPNRRSLQKQKKNWSELFPAQPDVGP